MRPVKAAPSPVVSARADDQALSARVSAEFREMPGLSITLAQAVRLFNVDRPRCERILGSLVQRGILATDGHTFARAGTGRRSA
jgi:hypothetical protein